MEFCECLKTDEEILQVQSEGKQQNRKTGQSSEHHQSIMSVNNKGSHHALNPMEEDANKNTKNKSESKNKNNDNKNPRCKPSACPWTQYVVI